MKVIKVLNFILNFIFVTFFVVSLFFSGYALYDVFSVYENSELSGKILKYKPSSVGFNEFGEKFSLTDIQAINPDIVGWVQIDGTNIDYPILAGTTNSDYLSIDYKKEYSPGGSIFLDYRNNRLFEDDFTVIYGHNMARNLMFSDIKKFKNSNFFDQHRTGRLYTKDAVYDLIIYTFNIVDANKDIGYKLHKYNNGKNADLIKNYVDSAINIRKMDVSMDDSFLLLSTCYGVASYDRSVLFTKMQKSKASNIIIPDSSSEDNKEVLLEQKIIKKNERKNLINRIIVLIVYVMIAGIIYMNLFIKFERKKKK